MRIPKDILHVKAPLEEVGHYHADNLLTTYLFKL
jgi:hypothetical protein